MESGVATRPIADMDAYRDQLQQFVYHSGTFMKPIFAKAKNAVAAGGKSRIVFAEGEEERVLRAVQVVIDEKIATPILIGRPACDRASAASASACGCGRTSTSPDQSRVRSALPRLLRELPPAGRAQRHHGAVRETRNAPPAHADRRHDDPQGRCRRHDLRHLRHARPAPALRRPGDRSPAWMQRLRGDEHRDAAGPTACDGRHAREPRPDRGADRRDHDAWRPSR